MPTEGLKKMPKIKNYASSTDELSPEEMVQIVDRCIANAEKNNAMVSGMTQKHIVYSYMETKNGFIGYNESTEFGHSMTLKRGEQETKTTLSVIDYSTFDLESQIEKLNSQLDSLKNPSTSRSWENCSNS